MLLRSCTRLLNAATSLVHPPCVALTSCREFSTTDGGDGGEAPPQVEEEKEKELPKPIKKTEGRLGQSGSFIPKGWVHDPNMATKANDSQPSVPGANPQDEGLNVSPEVVVGQQYDRRQQPGPSPFGGFLSPQGSTRSPVGNHIDSGASRSSATGLNEQQGGSKGLPQQMYNSLQHDLTRPLAVPNQNDFISPEGSAQDPARTPNMEGVSFYRGGGMPPQQGGKEVQHDIAALKGLSNPDEFLLSNSPENPPSGWRAEGGLGGWDPTAVAPDMNDMEESYDDMVTLASLEPKENLVDKYLSIECMSKSEVWKESQREARLDFQRHKNDVGSSEVQVAILSQRIRQMQEHMTKHRKDFSSRRGLEKMLNTRRKLLIYLRGKNFDKYCETIGKLGLKDVFVRHDRFALYRAKKERSQSGRAKD